MPDPLPSNEHESIRSLEALEILDTTAESLALTRDMFCVPSWLCRALEAIAECETQIGGRMQNDIPEYSVRKLEGATGYVIDVKWPGGRSDPLLGVYVSESYAADFVRDLIEGRTRLQSRE